MDNWKTYSVFVSSTFSDMQSERDYLNMVVFPQINQELKKIAVSLRIIDLRWGINTQEVQEDSIENKVLRVCFDEIDRSKPFFIGLLGQRYGWIPEVMPHKIKILGNAVSDLSITSMEIEYGFLNRNKIGGCIFLERTGDSYEGMDEPTRMRYDDAYSLIDESGKINKITKLSALKNRIKSKLKEQNREDHYIEYSVRWDGDHFTSLENFGEKVKKALLHDIFEEYGNEPEVTPFYEEQNRQDEFLYRNRTKIYNRKYVTDVLLEKMRSNIGGLILKGESGSGKSCVYTLLVDYFKQSTDTIILYHTTAVGQNSRYLYHMLKRWIFELEDTLGISHLNPIQSEECEIYFRNLIKQIPKNKKLILCIDALDGFIRSEATDYLTFYPKSTLLNIFLFCTSLPKNSQYPVEYNKNIELYDMPDLSEDDARQIISRYITFYHKELYPQNIEALLSVSNQGEFCYQCPLWLSISLHILMAINRVDFEYIATVNRSFDHTLQDYVNDLIKAFPVEENRLLVYFLDRLEQFYGSFPYKLFLLLSVSFNGLAEDVLMQVMKEDWDSRIFAIIRGYMGNYIAEQGEEKYWQIMHNKLRLQLTSMQKEALCKEIAACYMGRVENDEILNDNVLYYLYYGRCYDEAYQYYMKLYKNEERFLNELCQLSEIIDTDFLMDFLFQIFNKKAGSRCFIPAWIRMGSMKRMLEGVIKKKMYEGNYEKIPYMIDKFQEYMESLSIFGDFKTYIYITTDHLKINALDYLVGDAEVAEAYGKAMGHLKIRGLFSLLFVPICRKYYKWSILKLKK